MTAEAAPATPAAKGPFSSTMVLWLVLVGVFSFSALFVLLAYAPDLKTGADGKAHALSKSAIGFAGLSTLLKAEGRPVLISRAPIPRGRTEGLLVATPGESTELSAIQGLGFKGPVLVVLPKWFAGPDPFHKGWVSNASPIPPDMVSDKSLLGGAKRRTGTSRPRLHALEGPLAATPLVSGPIDQLQSFSAPGWSPVLVDEQGATILARYEKGPIYVLSDPDFLNTHGLKDLARARIGMAVLDSLRQGEGPVILDVTLNGFAKERSILRLLFDPPFLAVTLCLVAAAGLAGFQAFVRFGAVRRSGRVFALGKEALADNTAALIRMAGREHRMGGRYAALTRSFVARAVGAPRELTGPALTEFLDRLGRQKGAPGSLKAMTFDAETAADRGRVTDVAQRLYRWRLEMTRERQ